MERITNFRQSTKLNDKFHDLVPGGSHTYSKGEDQFPYLSPRLISHAKGAYCWDVDDNKYIDWAMGNRVFILGHGNDYVDNAVIEQIRKGLNFTKPGILEYEVAEFLVDFFPVAEMVKFGKNGSDVTTAAVKISRSFTGRNYVAMCKQHPFFSSNDWFIGTTACNNGIPEEEYKYSISFDYNDIDSVKRLFDEYPNQIACLILEPVKNDKPCKKEVCDSCENGICKKGTANFLSELRDICTKNGTVLIFDEMISGIRFDVKGAHHLYGVYPDLATYGKCISNGYSFSVLAGKREIMELGGLRHDKPRTFFISQTHASETVGLAACKATLEECVRVDVNKHIWALGKQLISTFNQLVKEEKSGDIIKIIGYDCNPQILCTHPNGEFWPELHTSFHEEMIAFGVFIPWITITYSHTQQELDYTLDVMRRAVKKIRMAVDQNKVNESFTGEAVKPVFRKYN